MFILLLGEPLMGTSKYIPSSTEKLLWDLMNHLSIKMEQCGWNRRDQDAYDKLRTAYDILVS